MIMKRKYKDHCISCGKRLNLMEWGVCHNCQDNNNKGDEL